jgi:hypothetical protein
MHPKNPEPAAGHASIATSVPLRWKKSMENIHNQTTDATNDLALSMRSHLGHLSAW